MPYRIFPLAAPTLQCIQSLIKELHVHIVQTEAVYKQELTAAGWYKILQFSNCNTGYLLVQVFRAATESAIQW